MNKQPFRPKEYQRLGASRCQVYKNFLLGDSVGLGKTATSILATHYVRAKQVLVVAPNKIVPQWPDEITWVLKTYGVHPTVYRITGWDDAPTLELLSKGTGPVFYLVNYEKFVDWRKRKDEVLPPNYTVNKQGKVCKKVRGKLKPQPSPLVQWLQAQTWDAVILDEVHRIKNRKSQRAQHIKRIPTKHKWGLSGTLVAEFPSDLWSPLNWIDSKTYSSFWYFVNTYCEREEVYIKGGERRMNIGGIKPPPDITLKLLRERTEKHLLLRTVDDVGMELPPVTVTDAVIELDPDQRKFYNQVKEEAVLSLIEDFGTPDVWSLRPANKLFLTNAITRFLRLQQVCSEPQIFGNVGKTSNAKLEWLRDWLEDGKPGAVIMTRFRNPVDGAVDGVGPIQQIEDLLNKYGRRDDFVVGTYATLSEGLNLQHFNYIIAWDPPQSRLDWEQAIGRIHRMGQQRKQFVYRLAGKKTADEHGWTMIDNKQRTVDMVTRWLREEVIDV